MIESSNRSSRPNQLVGDWVSASTLSKEACRAMAFDALRKDQHVSSGCPSIGLESRSASKHEHWLADFSVQLATPHERHKKLGC
jgi:hypothetical protein